MLHSQDLQQRIITIEGLQEVDNINGPLITDEPILLFGKIPIHRLSTISQFILCASGIFVFYILQSIVKEYLFTTYKDINFVTHLSLFQCLIYAMLSGIQIFITEKKITRNYMYSWVAFFGTTSMLLSNYSLKYLNYPTHAIVKSSKLLFVMIFGIFITGKTYKCLDYCSAILLVAGLMTLGLFDYENPRVNAPGMILLIGALIADAFVGNLQEKSLNNESKSTTRLIFWSHFEGAIMLIIFGILTGELRGNAMLEIITNTGLMLWIIIYTTVGYIAINFFMILMQGFGVLISLTTTNCRKVCSILLSYMIFPKPFLPGDLLSMLLVFSGVGLQIYNKNKETITKVLTNWYKKNPKDCL